MTRVPKLVLAAVLAGSIPALAAAREHEHDRTCEHERELRPVVVTPIFAPPPPAYAPAPPAPPRFREGWREPGRGDGGWRHRELEAVHARLARLDAERAEFHASNAWRPGKLRRYDRWYFERRAELERRERELERVAWR
jgi:hypothetical protein